MIGAIVCAAALISIFISAAVLALKKRDWGSAFVFGLFPFALVVICVAMLVSISEV